ncbi:type I polyketide synthase [Geminicoccus roseus]|uniref:type I polyketide synthase n=1 Tax=Geminicoccus roseus TaxID=404900 RepID=UPI0004260344|nr:type I polyketide synthase [Geminicoccus roseus]
MDAAATTRPAPIAVVGLGCRLPGQAEGPERFWNLLSTATDAVGPIPPERWDHDLWYDPDPAAPGKTRQREAGLIGAIDRFDAAQFGISPREAEAMDPQQRILLETVWQALEDAGELGHPTHGGRVGVFVGLYNNNYGLTGRGSPDPSLIGGWSASGTHTSIAAGRVAFTFDFTGPAISVDTACSSSLVAVHLAMQSLRAGECDMAIAAGVHLLLSPQGLVASSKLGATSPSSRCRPFDASADGFGHAEGCGVVVLRRAGEGVRARALIAGSAVNQDGRSAGLTAPSGPAQEAVLRAALADAGLSAEQVDAIEAHGTGTSLGDPIEMQALASVYGRRQRPLWVGSVKGNIGHAEAAAGVAGLIKAVLMVEQGAVPPSLHFTRLNPHIELDGADLRVPTRLERQPLQAVGVSSFGFSGTNAHVLVTKAPAPAAAPDVPARPVAVLPLAARSESQLETLRQGYLARLHDGADWPALAHSAALRQARLPWRLAVTASDGAGAAQALQAAQPARPNGRPKLGFLVTGQGSAYAGMALGLLPGAPVLRQVLERCDAVMGLDRRLEDLFADGAALGQTGYAQPALFALAVGLGRQLQAYGIEPAALLGHSVGEYAAVVLAGVLSLEDGAKLIAKRARLMQALPPGGGMAALLGPRAAAQALLRNHPELEIAAYNAPAAITVAGPSGAVERLAADPQAERAGLAVHVLPVSHAFHSRLLEPMLDELAQAAAGLPHGAPQVPVVGNLGGSVPPRWDGAYWRAHARSPVRFEQGLAALKDLGCDLLVELGPQPVLAGFARGILPALPTLARGREPWSVLLASLAELHRQGCDPDWPTLDQPFHLPLTHTPAYPFERQSYWLDDPTLVRGSSSAPPPRPAEAVGEEKVWGFYDQLAEIARTYEEQPDGHVDGHLTFGLLDAPEPGFSWIRVLFEGSAAGPQHALLTRSQRAIKELAFDSLDLGAIRRVMDFGCGHGADLITLAERAPHLDLHGFTISARQVAVGQARAAARGLSSRVHIHHGDSAKDPFPGRFDLIFGFEVAGLIADKAALFANIGSHLNPGGAMVMADFVADGDRIAALDTASYTPTPADWAELFAHQRLRITACVDTSTEVANFLDDPGFAEEVDRLVARYGFSELTRRHLLSNHNIMQALRRGLMRYLILAAHHEPAARPDLLRAANEAILRAPATRTATTLSPEASWFYRAVWQPRRIGQVAQDRRAELDRHAPAAQALDRLARHYVAVADLPTAQPAPAYQDLYAHLLKSAGAPAEDLPAAPDLPEADLLMRCGPHLRAVIEGRQDPLDLLFPGGDLSASTALYKDSPFTGAANAVAAEAFAELLAGFGPARVIEVGGGTGGTTQALLGRLRPGDHYLFTDVSPAFVSAGTRRFGLDGRVLDLERPLADQGVEPAGFDIVVAANVLHATADLAATLARVRELLRPGGALLLVENARPMLWGDLTFGLTEGMWRFADRGLRPNYALLPEPSWRDLLAQAGFETEAFDTGTEATAAASGLVVYLARRQNGRAIHGPDALEGATDILDTRAIGIREAGEVQAMVEAVLDLARAAVAMPAPPRLWLVTERARSVLPDERTIPAQAALLGVANTLALEHPELRVTVLDTDDPAQARQVVEHGSAETRLAVRRGQLHALRLLPQPMPAEPAAMRPDATYLVVGGLGGVGRQVAADLAAAGARHLVLAGPTPRTVEIEGCAVTVVRCDASSPDDIGALMQRAAICDPPVRGIFHVAGTLDDAVLAGQHGERLARVLAPKVTGADLLDRLSRHLPLDHFVLFSSSAALLGSAAQANHAAANAFLDSLAERRRAEGLPGLSVAWGAWGEVGAAAKVGEEVARRGLRPMPPAAASRALRRAMGQPAATLGIMDVDWPVFCARFGDALPPFFDAVAPSRTARPEAAATPAAPKPAGVPADLRDLPADARFDALVQRVRTASASILGLPGPDAVPAEAPLRDLGLDSLMTVELRNALATLAAAKLPATLVFDHPTCRDLAVFLAGGPLAGIVAPPAAAGPGDGFEDLDTDELAALLEQELAAAGRDLGETVG